MNCDEQQFAYVRSFVVELITPSREGRDRDREEQGEAKAKVEHIKRAPFVFIFVFHPSSLFTLPSIVSYLSLLDRKNDNKYNNFSRLLRLIYSHLSSLYPKTSGVPTGFLFDLFFSSLLWRQSLAGSRLYLPSFLASFLLFSLLDREPISHSSSFVRC
jgi:hypothetical protein